MKKQIISLLLLIFCITSTAQDSCREVLLETTMGNIRLALYNDTPLHRDNFIKLVNSGYYNGCIFQQIGRAHV